MPVASCERCYIFPCVTLADCAIRPRYLAGPKDTAAPSWGRTNLICPMCSPEGSRPSTLRPRGSQIAAGWWVRLLPVFHWLCSLCTTGSRLRGGRVPRRGLRWLWFCYWWDWPWSSSNRKAGPRNHSSPPFDRRNVPNTIYTPCVFRSATGTPARS